MALTLLALQGLMAVGKSTLSNALGATLGWPVVDKDDAADVLVDYLKDCNPPSYRIGFKQAGSLLRQRFNVVLVSPFRTKLGLDNAASVARAERAELKVIKCICPDKAEWRRRLETRAARLAHLIHTWQDFEAYWQTAEDDFDYPVHQPNLITDMTLPLSENINRIQTWLAA